MKKQMRRTTCILIIGLVFIVVLGCNKAKLKEEFVNGEQEVVNYIEY